MGVEPRMQKTLHQSYFKECFKKNKSRARAGIPALIFRDCEDIAKNVLVAHWVTGMTDGLDR